MFLLDLRMSAYIKRLFVLVACKWSCVDRQFGSMGFRNTKINVCFLVFLLDIYTFVDFILFCFGFFSPGLVHTWRGEGKKDFWKHMENVIKIKILTFQFFCELSGLFRNFIIKEEINSSMLINIYFLSLSYPYHWCRESKIKTRGEFCFEFYFWSIYRLLMTSALLLF